VSGSEYRRPTEADGGVLVVLPPYGYCPGTVRAAATFAVAADATLTIAVLLPMPDPFQGMVLALPYRELLFDYELQMTSELTQLLSPAGVRWNLLALYHPKQELPAAVRSVDASVVLVHECRQAWRLSPLRWRVRRLAELLARRTDARVQLFCVPPSECLSASESLLL
jgi:hypothetical protein